MNWKAYLLDTILVFGFWIIIALLNGIFFLHLSWAQLGEMTLAIAVTDLMFGGLYGRCVNKWRRMFNYT